MNRNYPKITINEEGEKWLGNGQIWMYKNNVVKLDEEIENGALIDIVTTKDRYLETGFLSRNSHITVRILSGDTADTFDRAFFKERIQFAYAYRKALESRNITSCRPIFGEANQLPDLTVDRYDDVLVSQISSCGLEQRKDMLCEVLLEVLGEDEQDVRGIYERDDIRMRAKEGLPLEKEYQKQMKLPTTTIIDESGLKLHIDVENRQRTGYFLDQKANRVLPHEIAHGRRVMNCFSHTGGFVSNVTYRDASQVVAVDVSQAALDQTYANAKLNHLENRISFVKMDVFKYLDTRKKGQSDIIVLDPPAFIKSGRTIDHTYGDYKRINKQAMVLLGRGDYFIICSCSHFMETGNFEKMLCGSAQEAGVTPKQVPVTQQNHDHPILWTMEETSYLKFYTFRVV